VATLAGLALALCACSDLRPLAPGTCGNTVIDPGEDCDVHADPSLGDQLACVPPGDPTRQCRYECAPGGPQCPLGWGCDRDGLCVHGVDRLEPTPGSPFDLASDDLAAGDVDGDGREDLIGTLPSGISVRFGADDGSLRAGFDWRGAVAGSGRPVVADLDGDGRADLLRPTALGVEVLRGDRERVASPVAYSPYTLGGFEAARLVPLRAANYAPEESLLLVGSVAGGVHLSVVPIPTTGFLPTYHLAEDRSVVDLADRVEVADLDGDGLDEVALTWAGADWVRIFSTSTSFLDGKTVVVERARVDLPTASSGRVFFGDVDGDGRLDLVAPLGDGSTVVARGGAGGALGPVAVDARFQALPAGARLLAVGDVDGDGVADYVTSAGTYLAASTAPWSLRPAEPPGTGTYVTAVIHDFNGDGRRDVAVTTADPCAVHVLVSAPSGLFTDRGYGCAGSAFGLRARDFDGDGVGDLTYVVRGTGGGDEVMVLFGETAGAPVSPVRVAHFSGIEHLEAARLRDSRNVLDAADDLVISMQPEQPAVRPLAFFVGSPWRQLSSPFALRTPGDPAAPADVLRFVAVGRFAAGDERPSWIAMADDLSDPRLWFVPGAAGAEYRLDDARTTWVSRVAGIPAGAPDLWVTGDLDGDGTDELLWLSTQTGRLEASLVRADVSGVLQATPIALAGQGVPRHGRFVDVDRDGFVDLLLTFDRGAMLYLGGPAGLSATPLPLDADDAVPIDLDGDRQRELVLLRDGALWPAEVSGTAPVAVVPWGAPIAAPGATRLATADVDGDGLDDLVASDGARVWIYRVVPHLAGEASP